MKFNNLQESGAVFQTKNPSWAEYTCFLAQQDNNSLVFFKVLYVEAIFYLINNGVEVIY